VPTRNPKTTDRELAQIQSRITDKDAQLSGDQRATEEDDGIYVPLTSRLTGDPKKDKGKTGKTETFRLGDEVSLMTFMEWAAASEDANGPASMAAYFHTFQDMVYSEDEFARFRKFGRENRCDYDDYRNFQHAAFEALSGNPTEQPAS
jgi:hypothetical protein